MPTCCFKFERGRSMARSDRCSNNGIPVWRTTIRPPPLKPSQREYPTNRHALLRAVTEPGAAAEVRGKGFSLLLLTRAGRPARVKPHGSPRRAAGP